MTDPQQQALVQQAATARGPYGDTVLAQVDRSRLRFHVSADADPQLPARVLALLTVRGELPLRFDFDCSGGDIALRFELRADMVLYPEQLLDRLLRLPTVREARVLPMTGDVD